MSLDLPLVRRDQDSAPFFEAAAEGVFLLRHCTRCGRFGPPALRRCRTCHSGELDWRPSEGTAELVSWSVVHGRASDDGAPEPTVVGLVQLSEGPWFTGRLADVEGRDLRAGMALEVRFVRPEGGEPLPVFAPR